MPLVWSDGLLLRPLAPAVPLPDSVFLDALNENRLYRVIAPLPGQSAAVVLYNLKHLSPAEPVQGKISLGDYKNAAALLNGNAAEAYASIPAEGIAAYSAEGGCALTPAQPDLDVKLTGFKDRLFIMAPIVRGWAVIGRGDKFLSSLRPGRRSGIRGGQPPLPREGIRPGRRLAREKPREGRERSRQEPGQRFL